MHAGLTLIYVLLFLRLIRSWSFMQLPGIPKYWVQGVFVLKVLVGLVLWAIYSWHYTYRDTSDAFRYFDDALLIYELLPESPGLYLRLLTGIGMDHPDLIPVLEKFRAWHSSYNYGLANDNPTVIRINSVVALFSFGYYHVHTVFMCFFSLMGSVAVYRFLYRAFSSAASWLFVACFMLPTLLFWSSGVLKEPVLWCVLGIFLVSLQTLFERKLSHVLLVLLAIWLLLQLKPYVLICFVPAVLFFVADKLLKWNKVLLFSLVHFFCGLIALFPGSLFPAGNLLYLLGKKRTDFYNVAHAQDAGSIVSIPELSGVGDFFLHLPQALSIAYFRPHFFELKSSFYFLASLEAACSALFLALAVWGMIRYRPALPSAWWFSLSVVLVLGTIIGFTVPVLGAVVRYKLPAMTFLMVLALPGVLKWKEKSGLFN